MKNFNRGGGFGDRKSSGGGFGRRDSGGRGFGRGGSDTGRPTMHQAVCTECGQACEVPFKPTGSKPVYCNNCFKGKEAAGPQRAGGGFGRRDSGSRGFNRGGSDGGRMAMHEAVCSECGQTCEVPFKPTGDKPVYCNNCFKGKDAGSSSRFGGRDFGKDSFQDKKMFKATCDNCGKACEVPFRPSAGKPVYCSDCFGKVDNAGGKNPSADQFKVLNDKLDKILRTLGASYPTAVVAKKEPVKEVVKEIAKEPVKEVKKIEPKKLAKKADKKVVAPKKAKKK
ncbi:MAG: CxxC-x17-CxxC domain-containing protein [Candidatus Buchananbacteria bacterium]